MLLAGSLPTAKEDERLAAVAAAFVGRGFAVMTTDSRGTGGSRGQLDSASLEQLAGDAAAAVAMLRQRADVRADAVGFWGVSQGASWVGPLAANGSVYFVRLVDCWSRAPAHVVFGAAPNTLPPQLGIPAVETLRAQVAGQLDACGAHVPRGIREWLVTGIDLLFGSRCL